MKNQITFFIFCQKIFVLKSTLILVSFGGSFAFADEFAGGAAELAPYSLERVIQRVEDGVKMACNRDSCTLAQVSSGGFKFDIGLNAGYGNNQGPGNGVVIIGNHPYNNRDNDRFVGASVTFSFSRCTTTVDVPESLYRAFNNYVYSLLNEDSSTKRNFTPGENTMLMLYNNILEQARGCSLN